MNTQNELKTTLILLPIVLKPMLYFLLHTAYRRKSKLLARLQQDFGKVFPTIRQKAGAPKHSVLVLPFFILYQQEEQIYNRPLWNFVCSSYRHPPASYKGFQCVNELCFLH